MHYCIIDVEKKWGYCRQAINLKKIGKRKGEKGEEGQIFKKR